MINTFFRSTMSCKCFTIIMNFEHFSYSDVCATEVALSLIFQYQSKIMIYIKEESIDRRLAIANCR